ncbi:MAG: hypothetical protein HY304_06945 [candidate division Zixibacteria bacterium]|nr:hypothetical protein [candidate division Zixibacteria bacterium]
MKPGRTISITALSLACVLGIADRPPAANAPAQQPGTSLIDLQIIIGRPIWLGPVIRYTVYDSVRVEARLSALDGELVSIFRLGVQGPGQYTLPWDGSVGDGVTLFEGKYFYELFFDDEYACKFWFLCRAINEPS